MESISPEFVRHIKVVSLTIFPAVPERVIRQVLHEKKMFPAFTYRCVGANSFLRVAILMTHHSNMMPTRDPVSLA